MRLLLVSVVLVAGCAPVQTQQSAAAPAPAPVAQQVNLETMCKATVDAYCGHCGLDQNQCSQAYINCLGGRSPANPSSFNTDQVAACSAAVQAGDCVVMQTTWPAACSVPDAPTCSGGASWDGTQCVCTGGTAWDGTQCATPAAAPATSTQGLPPTCSGGALWDGNQQQCVCPGGSVWDGAQCACPAGTSWDGATCAAAAQPAQQRPRRPSCRQVLLDKGYGVDQLGACKGANDRCVALLIDHGYGIDQLGSCHK